jgi:U4/U6.U5 tri-snRNP-associated protein 3
VLRCRERRRERKRREKEGKGREEKPADLMAGLTADEIMQMQQLGLPFGFRTTQGQEVDDPAAHESAVKITSQRKARQFMNRKGGFNRMLPAEQTGKKMQEV